MKRVKNLLISAIFLFFSAAGISFGKGDDFIISFGTGGIEKYTVVDNSCYSYLINYPKEEKTLSDTLNKVVFSTIVQAKKQFSKDNDGFINLDVKWQFIGKEKIVYQICGDVIRRR